MKNILVPTETHEVMASVLQTAALVQRRFRGYVEGFALRPAVPDYVPIDMVSGLAWHVDEKADEETRRAAFQLFESFMKEIGLPESPLGSPEPGYGWHAKAPAGDMFLASHARIFDLVVLGRPVSGKAQPSMASLEAVLFESGRPLLIAPPTPPTSLGETVVIAWNGSTETARTVAFAAPFLREAKRIIVLMVEGWSVPGPSGEQLASALRRCGLDVETVMAAREHRNDGETILARAQALGADLLVKGAYTQSRLRQMIFGGATAHILAHAAIPVLMAN
ncbi:universal stress protein [Enterovirga aerilata]|uniref:Universal stress protein n=1 Tax=Enterovirga aerilata TaxID=2730920 RepID=A0A849I6U9_9HYPH|nr:universal stress protein [Enterovirga sp. DB1703]NNM75212.1 universal stress protein [Enterovirga sp. DB1703]